MPHRLSFTTAIVISAVCTNAWSNDGVVMLKTVYHKVPPTQADGSVDPLTGTLALAHEDGAIALYPPDAFGDGTPDVASAPSIQPSVKTDPLKHPAHKVEATPRYVVRDNQSWLVYRTKNEPSGTWICDPTTLERIGVAQNALARYCGFDGARDGRIWVHGGSKNVRTFSVTTPDLIQDFPTKYVSICPSAKSSFLYSGKFLYQPIRGSEPNTIDGLNEKEDLDISYCLPDTKEKYCAVGQTLKSADQKTLYGDLAAVPKVFSHEDPILICWHALRKQISIVSVPGCNILARADVPEIEFGRNRSSADPEDPFHLDGLGKRVLIVGKSVVAEIDYSHLKIPEAENPSEVSLDNVPTVAAVTMKADGTTQLNYGADLGSLGPKHSNKPIKNANRKTATSSASPRVDKALWPSFPISNADVVLPDDFKDRLEFRQGRDAAPEGMAADGSHLAIWFARGLVLYDVETEKRIWAHRFDADILSVTLSDQYVFVDLKGLPERGSIQTLTMDRESGANPSPIDVLSRKSRSSSFSRNEACRSQGDLIYVPESQSPAMVLNSSTLEVVEMHSQRPRWQFDRVVDDGFEYLHAVGRPSLIFHAFKPVFAFKRSENLIKEPPLRIKELEYQRDEYANYANRITLGAPRPDIGTNTTPTDLVAYQGNRPIKTFPVSKITLPARSRTSITETDNYVLYYAHGRIFKIDRSALRLESLQPGLTFERQQSTLVTVPHRETSLTYRVYGGTPPIDVSITCWIDGPTPNTIQPKNVKATPLGDGYHEASFTFRSGEFDFVASTFFEMPDVVREVHSFASDRRRENRDYKDATALKETLNNFKKAHDALFTRATGQTVKQIPMAMPMRLRAVDAEGREGFFCHYLFHEYSGRNAVAAIKKGGFDPR